jgi:hypothetical protein
MARVATTNRGLTTPDLTYRIARALFTFEWALGSGLVLLLLGGGLDVMLLAGLAGNELAVAAMAQTLILIGGNVLFGGSLAAIVNEAA